MNKIYKVIWNEARNAYVVVSEIAKNHGSKSCSTKKLLAMLIATGVMTCASVAPAMAANLAPTETKIEIGEDASASGEGSVAIGQKAVASNLVAIAIGRDAVASGVDSIAIGSDTKATQKFSVAVGNDIGFTAYAGTAVGQQAYASGDNATAIGTMTNIDTKYNASHDDWRKAGAQSTAIGAYAGSWGVASTAVGGFSKAEGKLATAIGYNSQANVDYGTALGDYSEVKAGWGVAIGASSFADRESHVVGLYAPDEDKDSLTWKANAGAVSVGSSVEGQEITRQITNVAAGSADTDAVNVAQLNAVKAAAGKKVSLVDGENTKATLVKDDATGTQYKVDVDLSKYAKTEYVAVVYDKNKTSLRSTNASVAENAIALGKDASAVKDGGVALGNEAHAGNKGTSLGTKAKSDREGATVVGYNTNSSGLYSTVVGTDAVINTDGTAYQTPFKDVIVQGAAATVVGSKNTVDNQNNKVYSGVANNIMGAANTIKSSNGITIQGSGNTVTDAYKDMDIDLWGDGFAILGGDYSVLAKKQSGAIAVVGGANTVSKQTDSTVIGYDNRLIGDEKKGSHDVFMAGSHNRLNNVSDSIVMGNDNKISDRSNVISFGHKNAITANNAVAIGNGAGVSVEGGVALGVGSVANRAAGELVGYDPTTGKAYNIENGNALNYVWKATKGAVSVGSGRETRQITNVAAGAQDTDAVNVAQLKKVATEAGKHTQVKAGTNVGIVPGGTEDGTHVYTVNADGTTVSGDSNVAVTAGKKDANNVTNYGVKLNKDLKGIESISNGDAKLTLGGFTTELTNGKGAAITLFGDTTTINNKVTVYKDGRIAGVAAGINDKDAVNVGQLNAVGATANKGWNLTTAHGGTTTTVKPGDTVDFSPEDTNLTVTNEGTNVKIGLNQDLHLTSATFGNTTTINANGLTIGHGTAGLEFSQNRVSVGGQQIHDVADGKDDTDAVNVRQLKKAADSAKTTVVAGKNIKVDADTKKDGHTEYNVSLDDDITLGDKASNEFVTVSGTKGTIWAGHSVSAGTVIMDGDSGTITGLTNTTWNGTTDNLSRAATEGQLKQVADAATSNDKRLVQNPNDSDGSYQVKENGDVTLRVEDSNKNGYNVTIKDVASKAELDKVKTDVGNVDGFHDEIKNKDTNGKPTHTSVVDAVNNLDTKVNTIQSDVTKATEEAKKHSSVSTGNGLDLDVTDNNGQKDYKVSLKDDFTLGGKDGHTGSIEFKGSEGNITASGTLTANAVSVGNTSISDTGLQIGNKTSLTEDALTIGGNTYITDKGIDANQQKISNVADGDISKDSKDAVNGSQLYATNEAIANNYNNITNLNGRISNLDNRVNKVGAGAAALAALHPLDFDPDAKWDFAAGYGNYRGANAAAVGAYYRPNEDTMFSVGGTFGNGENMVNAGVSFKLGSGSSHVSTSRVAMAKEIKELRGELEAMKSAMLDANAGKKIDTSKLQLFPDVPQNHWAYEYVAQLAGNGMIEGYPDGNFAGDRPMTRYEFAAILYRAMTKGAVLSDKILSEFSHELEYFTVDTIAKDKAGNPTIQRVRTVKENKNK
ncbi:ESPR-type extended signal peptide-containing protein [Megasphaera elsdenii]|uniref:ESPR-type extended signal peptide-containing protein n=1 Tax=Megasphaera elsdenii TaxID=907 RepID=UPI00242CEEAF|nr:ESPR-type extended signal peptide-containing protein [Megasphaera elsdenii]